MKLFSKIVIILLLVVLSFYSYRKIYGIEVVTTADAFSIPAIEQNLHTRKNIESVFLLDITPAPWPEEAKWIYRFAYLGIPVKIGLRDGLGYKYFEIRGINSDGHLIAVFPQTKEGALAMKLIGIE